MLLAFIISVVAINIAIVFHKRRQFEMVIGDAIAKTPNSMNLPEPETGTVDYESQPTLVSLEMGPYSFDTNRTPDEGSALGFSASEATISSHRHLMSTNKNERAENEYVEQDPPPNPQISVTDQSKNIVSSFEYREKINTHT